MLSQPAHLTNTERHCCPVDANESRDWHIWADLAAVLIRRARKLYASDTLGVELDNTVYALDSSTVDLCLNLFGWAPFRRRARKALPASMPLGVRVKNRNCFGSWPVKRPRNMS